MVQMEQDKLFIQYEYYWWGDIYCPAALVVGRGEEISRVGEGL